MKTAQKTRRRGFTLLELLVAMGITSVLIIVLVALTGVAIDSWRQSRDDLRGSRLGRTALQSVGRDFESLLRPRGNSNEWLAAQVEPEIISGGGLGGPASGDTIPNAVQVVFFNSPTDRYLGDVLTNPGDVLTKPGDVSAIAYRLVYRDPVLDADQGAADAVPTFTLYRRLINPVDAFQNLYQVPDLLDAYNNNYGAQDLTAQNFLVENIYEFTLNFRVENTDNNGVTTRRYVPITINAQNNTFQELHVYGDRIVTLPADPQIAGGRIVGVSISITVLTDEGLALAKQGAINQADLIQRYSYRFSRAVITPSN